jgi:hypothetical protein
MRSFRFSASICCVEWILERLVVNDAECAAKLVTEPLGERHASNVKVGPIECRLVVATLEENNPLGEIALKRRAHGKQATETANGIGDVDAGIAAKRQSSVFLTGAPPKESFI